MQATFLVPSIVSYTSTGQYNLLSPTSVIQVYRGTRWEHLLPGFPRHERGVDGEHLLAVRTQLPDGCALIVMVMEPGHQYPKPEATTRGGATVLTSCYANVMAAVVAAMFAGLLQLNTF